jgi:hypothetical protein
MGSGLRVWSCEQHAEGFKKPWVAERWRESCTQAAKLRVRPKFADPVSPAESPARVAVPSSVQHPTQLPHQLDPSVIGAIRMLQEDSGNPHGFKLGELVGDLGNGTDQAAIP